MLRQIAPTANIIPFWEKTENGITVKQDGFKYFLTDHLNVYADPDGQYKYIRVNPKNNTATGIEKHSALSQLVVEELDRKLDDPLRRKVKSAFLNRFASTFPKHLQNILPTKRVGVVSDPEHKVRFFYDDIFVEVTKDSVEAKEYSDLHRPIWEEQKLDREWRGMCNWEDSNYWDFIQCVCKIDQIQSIFEDVSDRDREQCFKDAIGYLLHSFKDPAVSPAIVLIDAFFGGTDTAEANGGTGKSLFAKSILRMKKGKSFDGRNFSNTSRFKFQGISKMHDVLFFDDVPTDFEFGKLFVALTNDMDIEEKYKSTRTIDFEVSPKFMISTNFTFLRNSGESDWQIN